MSRILIKYKIYLSILLFLIYPGLFSIMAQDPVTVYPQEYPDALSNPLKGFRPNLNDAGDPDYPYPTIVRHYIRWNQIENSENDGVQKIIDFCNAEWESLEEMNVKVIPRVYIEWYNTNGDEYWPADIVDSLGWDTWDERYWSSDLVKRRVVKLIQKLGEAWDNDPRVAWIQTGLIGYWGEQENPVGVDEEGWAEIIGDAYESAFQNKKLLVRNQDDWPNYEFGVYWDSYGHPGQTNGSWADIRNTTAQGRYLNEVVEGEVAYNWGEDSFDPLYGGEPEITLNNYNYSSNMIDVIRELHCTGLGWIASYDLDGSFGTNPNSIKANASNMQKAFGYRYIIPEFTCSSRTDQGEVLDISFNVKNEGSAPFYHPWPLAFTLIDEKTKQIIWTEKIQDVDIRQWLPGSNYNYTTRDYDTPAPVYQIDTSFIVPDNIPAGQYMAGIAILDPTTHLPGIFFAVENFLAESQSQPLCRIGIGEDLEGSSEIDPSVFSDPLENDTRFYSMSETSNVHISYPADGSDFSPPADFPVYVSAFKNGGTIDGVELYVNNILEGTLHASPYIFNVSLLEPGVHSIEAKAYDDEGAIQTDLVTVNLKIPGGLPWIEEFEQPNGTKSDDGETSWTSSRGGGIFEVRNGSFEVSDGKTFIGEFVTGVIDIAAAPVTVSLDVSANKGGLDKGEDYVKLYKIVDGGSEVLIDMVDGAESKTLTESNITGESLQLVIRGYTTFDGEVYLFDNLSVTYDIPVLTRDIAILVNGNGMVDPPAGIHTYYEGQSVILTASPNFGYEFDSWSGDLSGTVNPQSIIMDTEKTVTANFIELPEYTLSTTATNGSISLSEPGGNYYEGTRLTLTATPDPGYKFTGWDGDLSGSETPVTLTIDGDKNVIAYFEEIPTYALTVTASTGTVSMDPAGGSYPEGTEVTLNAYPEAGYEFDGWSGDLSGSGNPVTLAMDEDKNITANFIEISTYILTVTATNGFVSLDPSGGSYLEGTEVTLNASPEAGYEFDGWSGDLSGSENPVILMMDGNKSITAYFVEIPTYTITVTATNGSVSMDPSGGSYLEGTEVTLTAIPETGYEFTGWSGDVSGTTNPHTITLNDDLTLTANFDFIIGIPEHNLPVNTYLGQNHPNPFSTQTIIPYQLSNDSYIKLTIYNILGEHVVTLVNEYQDAGYYKVDWKASDLGIKNTPGAIYIYRLETDNHVYIKKLILGQ